MTIQTEVFARRMREERRRAGVSQADLAQRLTEMIGRQVDPSAVARAEKHQRGVRLDEAIAIAEVLGVGLEAMLRDRGAVDDELDQLRQELSQHVWQQDQARNQLSRAQDSIAATERRIAELEASESG